MANLDEYYINLKNQTNNQLGLYLFCCSIGVIWTVYVLFFNSRVIGSVCTFCINLYLKRYSKSVWIRIRSLSISFLSGKIMFRGVHYVTLDYMVYVQDGWITFAYWKPQFLKMREKSTATVNNNTTGATTTNTSTSFPKDTNDVKNSKDTKTENLKRTARLNISLCNFQLHYYNSWKADPNDDEAQFLNNFKMSSSGSSVNNASMSSNEHINNKNRTSFKRNFSSSSIFNFITGQNASNHNNLSGSTNLNNMKNVNIGVGPSKSNIANSNNSDYNFTEDLMQLFSVVNIRIQKGRVFAGNSTLASTLSMRLSNAKMELVTEKSQSKVDDYCFILKGELNKLEISFIPNKKFNYPLNEYNQMNTEKKIENRVLVFRCVSSDFKYVQDVPSILTFDRRYLQKSETGELIQNEKEPQWSLLLNCNKHTIINYGPWFDRQREALWKFFFPSTYEKLEPQPEPTLNERRQTSKFDFFLYLKDPNSEVNLLFTSNNFKYPDNFDGKIYNLNDLKKNFSPIERKLTLKCRSESLLECSIPWLTKQYGYKTKIKGIFNSVQSCTNMSFKEFLNAERINLDVEINYPLIWNDMQRWKIDIELIKSSLFIVYYHKNYFQDLINDWSSRQMSDIRSFVPYVYEIDLKAKDIEVILPCNEHNWIDINNLENNAFFEVLATRANLKISFPFEEFLPEKTNINLDIKIFDGCARFIVPPLNSNLMLLKILRKNINYISIENGQQNIFDSKKWSRWNCQQQQSDQPNIVNNENRNGDDSIKHSNKNNLKSNKKTSRSNNLNNQKNQSTKLNNNTRTNNNQKYYKNSASMQSQDHYNNNASNHFKENWFECWQAQYVDVILNFEYHPCCVIDWGKSDLPSVSHYQSFKSPNFDCELFSPDVITLKIEIGPSNVMLYGTFLKRLWYIKEGYFSWDQFYSDIIDLNDMSTTSNNFDKTKNEFSVSKPYYDVPIALVSCNQKDPRNFRPLSVFLSLAIHNINGHLILDSTGNVPFPIGFTDRLALELEKTYNETKLQLYVDPINIFVEDLLPRSYDCNLSQGHLCLSSVQVRGHAMFSDEGRVKTDTLEYAWLLEILMGDLTGSITPIQTEQIVHGVETLLTLILDNEYQLQPVYSNRIDPGLPYKYEVTRFSLDLVDIYLVESGTALNFNLHPVRLSVCNSHTENYAKGLSACISQFKLTLFVNEASRDENTNKSTSFSMPNLNKYHNDMTSASYLENFDANPTAYGDLISNLSARNFSSGSSISLSSLGSTLSPSIDGSTIINLNSDYQNLYKSNLDDTLQNVDDSLYTKEDNTLTKDNLNNIYSPLKLKKSLVKLPDSNEFNYWFECSAFSSGKIIFDLALEKGNPGGQFDFLKLHDRKTKRLYFLWTVNDFKDTQKTRQSMDQHKIDQIFNQDEKMKRRCGCFGGCSFYSVFDEANPNLSEAEIIKQRSNEFFDLNSSITRSNLNFAQSLFYPGKHILMSQAIMMKKYECKNYNYKNDMVSFNDNSKKSGLNCQNLNGFTREYNLNSENEYDEHDLKEKIDEFSELSLKSLDNNDENGILTTLSNSKKPRSSFSSSLSLNNKSESYNSVIQKEELLGAESLNKLQNNRISSLGSSVSSAKSSSISLYSLSNGNPNEDDYYTADEQDEEEGLQTLKRIDSKSKLAKNKIKENLNQDNVSLKSKVSSNRSIKSQLSFASVIKKNLETPPKISQFNNNQNQTNNETTKMALNFDIQRPILDSSLPKYCYLKYLSRASVENWNKYNYYPFYSDYHGNNIFFTYRQKGIDFGQITTNPQNSGHFKSEGCKKQSIEKDSDLVVVNCRVNLQFSTFECYVTPLALTGLSRFTQALQSYEINPNSLITELQTKSQAHAAANSIIEAISKTQVSVKIPQIRLFALQCGLAEGDKITNAFVNTLANPDEFITLSLFIISIYNIETQLIDSLSKTAAIFLIDKIDTQFCRLFEDKNDPLMQNSPNLLNIKLSCIPDEYSKTSIKCFKHKRDEKSDKQQNSRNLKGLIMYESVFDQISIKAIKKSNDLTHESVNKKMSQDFSSEITENDANNQILKDHKLHRNLSKIFEANSNNDSKQKATSSTLSSLQQSNMNRFSLFEFDISKIWFSFPEPPASPKGKRKIPYTRYDWNLLSSVSPAVTSWLCASKHTLTPLKEFLLTRNNNIIQILAGLIIGSFKNKDQLEQLIEYEYQIEKYDQFKNEKNFGSRLKNKIGGSNKPSNLYVTINTDIQGPSSYHQQLNIANSNSYAQRFILFYLTKSSLSFQRDANCRLANIIRHYLYYFEEDFKADLASNSIPDIKSLKRGINEVLNSWTTSILSYIYKGHYFNNINYNGNINTSDKDQMAYKILVDNATTLIEQNRKSQEQENFKFFTEIRENNNLNNEILNEAPTVKILMDSDSQNEVNQISNQITNNSVENSQSGNTGDSNEFKETNRLKILKDNLQQKLNSSKSNSLKNPVYETTNSIIISNNINKNKNTEQTESGRTVLNLSCNSPSSGDESNLENNFTLNDASNLPDGLNNLLTTESYKPNQDSDDKGTLHSGQVGPQLKNTSKIFKPILNFIGIDAPSGTIMDNLFKEFGSLLFGNLNIKSVDINILGRQILSSENQAENAKKAFGHSNIYNKKSSSSKDGATSNFNNQVKLDSEKVITTILSFDELLVSINIRQVLPENVHTNSNNNSKKLSSRIETAVNVSYQKQQPDNTAQLSMSNPVYNPILNSNSDTFESSTSKILNHYSIPKYYTKIDAGIQLNNLTQEVNMPLLRLVHQLYSIIADAIEYDKEQNKLIAKNVFNANNLNNLSNLSHGNDNRQESKNTNQAQEPHIKGSNNKDCWRFMDQILELRDFVPEPKYIETNELGGLGRINSQKVSNKQKYVHITKDLFLKEKSLISLFGWVFVKRINSKAGLGTLAFSGEMNNVQLSALLDRKMIGLNNLKSQYEGSLNMRMDSTLGKLIENDTKQNVVQMNVAKSHVFGYFKNFNINNIISSFLHIGQIYIDVPLRPMVVHGVVYRESKVIEQNILPEIKNFVIFENQDETTTSPNQENETKTTTNIPGKENSSVQHLDNDKLIGSLNLTLNSSSNTNKITNTLKNDQLKSSQSQNASNLKMKKKQPSFLNKKKNEQHNIKIEQENNALINKFTFQLKSKLDGCEIRAKLLESPCLKAAYLINNVECNAFIKNERSKISCLLNSHCLSFQCDDDIGNGCEPTNGSSNDYASSLLGMMSMKPLEERTNFFLPSISLIGSHSSKSLQLETQIDQNIATTPSNKKVSQSETIKNSKLLNLIEVQAKVKISPLNRELNAQVIAQLVFVTKVFIKEMNFILLAVYGLDNNGNNNNQQHQQQQQQQQQNAKSNLVASSSGGSITRFFYDFKIEMGKILLTGITPSNTALTIFTGDKSVLMLRNTSLLTDSASANTSFILLDHKFDLKSILSSDYTLKPSIEAKCNFSVELKTALNLSSLINDNEDEYENEKPSNQNENDEEKSNDLGNSSWYQLAYFNTKFDLRNAVRTVNSHLDRESIIITVEKPRFYLQPGAVDCALLFWLNYKSTYEFWLQQRQQFANFLIDQDVFTPQNYTSLASAETTSVKSNQSQSNSNFLALKLRVTGLGVALPLSNKMTQDFFKTNTDCLVISLNETVIYACSSGCVVSKGQFNNFSLRFTENFNLSSNEWSPLQFQDIHLNTNTKMPIITSKNLMNAWIVPSGNYEICSSTIEKPKDKLSSLPSKTIETNISKVSPIWILSVKWKMEGIEVNLDTNVGKWLSKLADTVTRLAETQNINETSNNIADHDVEIKKLKKELNYYIEKGDNAKINAIQSRLDMLNLASYPERAKQIFVKTRNNLKGQLGFNTNHQLLSTPIKSGVKLPDASANVGNSVNVNHDQAATPYEYSDNLIKAFQRRHSAPNDEILHLKGRRLKAENFKNECLIEENESDMVKNNEDQTSINSSKLDKRSLNLPSNQQPQISQSAPAIDFKLNVKIEIKSGKCILHANSNNQNSKNGGANVKSENLKATEFHGGPSLANYFAGVNLNDFRNLNLVNSLMQNTMNQGGMGVNNQLPDHDSRNTNFIFPAIGVKAFYESTHKEINNRLTKKANLYAMIKLESFVMPHSYTQVTNRDFFNSRDMCISPALLDFLEQTLEPFDLVKASFESASASLTPGFNKFNNNKSNNFQASPNYSNNFNKKNKKHQNEDLNDNNEKLESDEDDDQESTSSDENDEKNLNNVQNVVFRDKKLNLSSQSYEQQQKLQEPAYFPVDVVVFVSMLPSSIRFTCLPHSTMECLLKLPTLEMVFSTNRLDSHYKDDLTSRLRNSSIEESNEVLNNFEDLFKGPSYSYSAKNNINPNKIRTLSTSNSNTNEGGLSITCSMTDFSLKFYNRLAIRNHSDARFFYSEASNYTEDKDSLSVRVAYIKVNISRSRRVSKLTNDPSATLNDVKLSVLADIGSSSFTYDMRNIKEVFVFPKIWYRRSLARRLFLGEETSVRFNNNNDETNKENSLNTQNMKNSYKALSPELKRPKTLDLSVNNEEKNLYMSLNTNWKTLVLISVNLVGLEIKMNVGNVMGNVCLLTKNARLISKISISRFGPKDMLFNFALDNARLIAEGGSNACLLRIQDITSSIEVNDKNKLTKCPFHKIDFLIYATECRIDSAYNQASPILAFRLSNLNLKLSDSWISQPSLQITGSDKVLESFLELNITWDQLHLMITRSTTPDLIMLFYKLTDFFEKQFTESKDYIKECELDLFYEIKVKQQFIEKKETFIKRSCVNGGNIQLKGNNFTLITFHGNNFKAKKWAVFSLNEPSMDFASQTYYKNQNSDDMLIQQNLGFYLGRNERKKDMASIYMVYRDSTSIFTRFQTINEWFEYAHSSIDAVGLRDFPRFSTDINPLFQSVKKNKVNEQTKWEEIFHLPSLQIFCDTTQENNIVKFEFKTDFHDHIQLTFRTELFGFLHELITSYIKEKDVIKGKEDYIPESKKDDRTYECIRWDLEPTLRLISKFGSSVEPSGVDALLKSLGFHHARSTIPKWFQRGLLDNLHDVMHQLIKIYGKMISDYDISNANENTNLNLK